ncbi:MAG: hypothetical protein U5N56_06560 [Candidatus Marinimicrobia bacterium]|nr:hypothetical protein [Candidatus Neomarinimicrobiota bacterium]
MKKLLWAVLLISQFVFAANAGIIPTPQQLEFSGRRLRLSARADFELVEIRKI